MRIQAADATLAGGQRFEYKNSALWARRARKHAKYRVALVVPIVAHYIIIRLVNASYILLRISSFIAARCILITLSTGLCIAVSCNTTSSDCIKLGQCCQFGNVEYNSRLWKAMKPIAMRTGNRFYLETPQFLLDWFANIISQHVHLLLWFWMPAVIINELIIVVVELHKLYKPE